MQEDFDLGFELKDVKDDRERVVLEKGRYLVRVKRLAKIKSKDSSKHDTIVADLKIEAVDDDANRHFVGQQAGEFINLHPDIRWRIKRFAMAILGKPEWKPSEMIDKQIVLICDEPTKEYGTSCQNYLHVSRWQGEKKQGDAPPPEPTGGDEVAF